MRGPISRGEALDLPPEFWIFALVGALAQLIDGALGMGYGVVSSTVLLSRVKRPCALQAWGKRLAEAKGGKRARVAVARKLAVLLHRLWASDMDFRWA